LAGRVASCPGHCGPRAQSMSAEPCWHVHCVSQEEESAPGLDRLGSLHGGRLP